MNAFYLAAAVVVITAISHAILSMAIGKVRDTATHHPNRLRGVTQQDALAKVAQWETSRKRLWPLAMLVAAGLVVFGVLGQ